MRTRKTIKLVGVVRRIKQLQLQEEHTNINKKQNRTEKETEKYPIKEEVR